MFGDIYSGKRVLVTGHTGFKGSWLCEWLISLGASVCGISCEIPTTPSNFVIANLGSRMKHHLADVRDLDAMRQIFTDFRPDFVFHLAAQAIVSASYHDPLGTLSSNVMGTAHILEILRLADWPVIAVLITSDKCYENLEWPWGYRENDRVGGKDIYSASKGAADIVISSYWRTYFAKGHPFARLASGRAGNVIGGGDWAKDRIVADCIRSWGEGRPVTIRSPDSTRPWQHVLEPLSGYLSLGAKLASDARLGGEAFNFGPRSEQNQTVRNLIESLARNWGFNRVSESYEVQGDQTYNEAGLLKLNCDKALSLLHWTPTLDYSECIDFTGSWYSFWHKGGNASRLTQEQIATYAEKARERNVAWAAS